MTSVSVEPDGRYLTLKTQTGHYRFHAIWLRDNSPDDTTRSEANGQRLITLREVNPDTHISEAHLTGETLEIHFLPESRSLMFSLAWLLDHAYDKPAATCTGWIDAGIETWDGSLKSNLPEADFHSVKTDMESKRDWLGKLCQFGFAKLTGGPVEDQALMLVVDLFGYVRETNYGRHFEVRTEINPVNLAFTGLALQAHTDNPYRDPIPTVQVLYCLESSAQGGENAVVDGFRAAQRLQAENPDWFTALSGHCAQFEHTGEAGVRLRARRPMIELSPDGELIAVRFNNRSTAAITDVPFDQMETYYAAYRRFGEIIDDPAMEITFRLEPGECFIVDNTRVLHARKAYSASGTRWLQGCYADKDSLLSTLASLQNQNQKDAV